MLLQWRELFQGFTLKKLNDDFYPSINICSFYVANEMLLGIVFVQDKKNVLVY